MMRFTHVFRSEAAMRFSSRHVSFHSETGLKSGVVSSRVIRSLTDAKHLNSPDFFTADQRLVAGDAEQRPESVTLGPAENRVPTDRIPIGSARPSPGAFLRLILIGPF